MLSRSVAASLIGLVLGSLSPAEENISLKKAKFEELERAIAAHRGKVVVVDFWATYCSPCKKEFPHLVEIHREYAGKVVAISVSVDDEEDADKALKFLRQQKATFENFLLVEPAEAYQKRYDFVAVPLVLVYGRDGSIARRFKSDDEEFTYKDVRGFLQTLVK
jgi:thiol-disulfide isomerase/thioredoxin